MSAPAKTTGCDLDDASLYSREPYIAALRLIPRCYRIDNAPDLLDIVIQKIASKYGGRHYPAIRDPVCIISLFFRLHGKRVWILTLGGTAR